MSSDLVRSIAADFRPAFAPRLKVAFELPSGSARLGETPSALTRRALSALRQVVGELQLHLPLESGEVGCDGVDFLVEVSFASGAVVRSSVWSPSWTEQPRAAALFSALLDAAGDAVPQTLSEIEEVRTYLSAGLPLERSLEVLTLQAEIPETLCSYLAEELEAKGLLCVDLSVVDGLCAAALHLVAASGLQVVARPSLKGALEAAGVAPERLHRSLAAGLDAGRFGPRLAHLKQQAWSLLAYFPGVISIGLESEGVVVLVRSQAEQQAIESRLADAGLGEVRLRLSGSASR